MRRGAILIALVVGVSCASAAGIGTFCLNPDGSATQWLNEKGQNPTFTIYTEFVKNQVFGVCPVIASEVEAE